MYKSLFGYAQILEKQGFFMIVWTNKSKISIMQPYNLAKLRSNGETNLAGAL